MRFYIENTVKSTPDIQRELKKINPTLNFYIDSGSSFSVDMDVPVEWYPTDFTPEQIENRIIFRWDKMNPGCRQEYESLRDKVVALLQQFMNNVIQNYDFSHYKDVKVEHYIEVAEYSDTIASICSRYTRIK